MSAEQDILVIGAGVMGCALGWRLASAGARVVVLERAIPGAEASSRAAGMLAAQGEADGAGPFLELCLASRSRWAEFAGQLAEVSEMDLGYRRRGILYPALSVAQAEALEERTRWQRALGLGAEMLTASEVRDLEPALGGEVLGGMFVPEGGQVSSPDLARALHLAAVRAGCDLRSGVLVEGIEAPNSPGRPVAVVTKGGGRLEAEAVVVAGGAWTSLVPGLGIPEGVVGPARGQMLAIATPHPTLTRPVFADGLGYAVPTSDGRTLVGSTMEMVGFERAVTVDGLAHMTGVARRLVPDLGGAPVLDSWCAFRPWTSDGLPVLGPAPVEGVHLAAGHFRNGILLVPITAEAVSAAVLGETGPIDLAPFDPARFAKRAVGRRDVSRTGE